MYASLRNRLHIAERIPILVSSGPALSPQAALNLQSVTVIELAFYRCRLTTSSTDTATATAAAYGNVHTRSGRGSCRKYNKHPDRIRNPLRRCPSLS